MNLKRLAVYGRVSSEEQAENQYAAEQQLAYLRTTGVDDRQHLLSI
jgi:DNA invertase Pin-like site-specific DNA recombinase